MMCPWIKIIPLGVTDHTWGWIQHHMHKWLLNNMDDVRTETFYMMETSVLIIYWLRSFLLSSLLLFFNRRFHIYLALRSSLVNPCHVHALHLLSTKSFQLSLLQICKSEWASRLGFSIAQWKLFLDFGHLGDGLFRLDNGFSESYTLHFFALSSCHIPKLWNVKNKKNRNHVCLSWFKFSQGFKTFWII
jgi:hypothetical protein